MRNMFKTVTSLTAASAFLVALSVSATAAGPGTAPKAKGPKVSAVSSKSKTVAPKTKVSAPKSKAPVAKGPKNTASKPVKAAAAGKSKKTTVAPATPPSATAPTAAPTAGAAWAPTNAVSQKLSTKPNLLARVKNALPAGTDLNAATAGFKNFGQFIAATNVSTNLGIDFGKLKASMTGTDLAGLPTGQPTTSLGQAIQKLKPGVDATAEASRAETLAARQIDGN